MINAEFAQGDLQGGAPVAALFGGEDGAVIGQHAGRCAPVGEGGDEGVDDVWAGRDGSGDTSDGGPGVVVDDVEDFHLAVIGQAPVGGVGLPALIGLFGFEAFP
ncbi:MAG: hypothetical protein QOC62_3911 [Mycobacterium sp.]|nr:hypothetical protein [Mycobacterium sp.]